MTDKFQPLKGTRDFLPREKIARKKIIKVLTDTFEEFGFNPIETPAIERWEIATLKGSSDESTDVYKETYRFKDQGDRDLVLRYELTFPLARLMAANPQIPKPFKRYHIGKVWRDGPVKKGRYREFWQCDVDTVGSDSVIADAEMLAMYTRVFERLGLDVVIKINNRRFLDGLIASAGIPEELRKGMMISLDKLEKIGEEGVIEDAKERGISEENVRKIFDLVDNIDQIFDERVRKGMDEINDLIEKAKVLGAKNMEFCPTLTRGLTYYTGPIFEVFMKASEFKSALAGGGRWDKMISQFTDSVVEVPATGTSFGLDTIYDALVMEKKVRDEKSVVDVFVIPIKTRDYCMKVLNELRELGVRADMDLMDRSLSKNLSHANSLAIPYCIIVGQKELMQKSVNMRDMKTGKESLISFEDLKKEIKNVKK